MKKKILFVAAMLTAFLFPTTTLEAQPGERSLNRRYQNEIRDSLAQVVHNRQVQMQRYAEQTLATLPNERKLYDENYISVTAELIDTTYADGDLHLDLLYRLSYNCRHLEGYTDDYPLGAYDVEASNSCMAICDLTKHFIEKVMGDLFTQGTEALITITSSADGTEIVSSLPYDGRYGDYRYCPLTFNGETLRISVDRTSGINNNCQLAYIRAQALRTYLEENVPALRKTLNSYRYIAQSHPDSLNTHYYRRSSIEIRLSDVFSQTVQRMRDAKMQDDYVDYNIPATNVKNPDTYVLVIANQSYDNPFIPDVPYARNDGEIVRQYCVRALGVPERQVKLLNDASKETILQEGIHWLSDLAKAVASHNGDETSPTADIVIYYAGHGYTDLDGVPYLLPNSIDVGKIPALQMNPKKGCSLFGGKSDGPNDTLNHDILLTKKESSQLASQCLSLDQLCSLLNSKTVPVRNLTVILDASFDGNSREGNPIVRADRKIDPKKKSRKLNMRSDAVVLMAADINKTAFAFDHHSHGFLTYFLLHEIKLQRDRFFNLNYLDIFQTVERKLNKESALQNRWQEISGIAGGRYKDGSWQRLKVKN